MYFPDRLWDTVHMEKKNYEREKTQDSRGRKKPYEKKAYEKKEGNGKTYHTPKNAYGGKPYRNEKERAGDRERYQKRDRSSANRFASKPIDDTERHENTEQYTDTSMAQMPEKMDTPYTVTEDELAETDTGLVVGRNAVRELLRSGRPVDKLYVSGREGSITASPSRRRRNAAFPLWTRRRRSWIFWQTASTTRVSSHRRRQRNTSRSRICCGLRRIVGKCR